ncbi:hypothetical protein DBR40_03755 [Pedobacter sp. KBW01]|uniref:hypothetical protein n=1 Tax=Pedobacter sp. KBW01 TaxID=2153364 RepID=UPI000F58FC68|nr:hypothetical protein [Pedobacter sp. KBW01]RQO78850.1 hypothetical protein DBR40_03755 [Pedobacter sp. KBW01]
MNTLINWIPYQLVYEENDWQLLWVDLEDRHIQEPFFDETIQLCRIRMKERSGYLPTSSLDFLVELAKQIDSIPPNAFIFHVSRCGSTLLSQALATALTNIVFPEARLIDEILRMKEQDPTVTEEQQELLLKSTIAIMGQKRKPAYKQLFVKLDSWHIHFYPLLRKWYPSTPFFFLSREPNAVIASHHQRRGLHAVPGMVNSTILKVEVQEKHYQDFNLFTAEVLANYYKTLADIMLVNHPKNTFFDYNWGVDLLLSHFLNVVQWDKSAYEKMAERLKYHSKSPGEKFSGDNKLKLVSYADVLTAYENFSKQLTKLN